VVPSTPRSGSTAIAAAALADAIEVLSATPAARRTIVLSGRYPVPAGWHAVARREDGRATRLVHAYADTARTGTPSLLVGMDTPQLRPALLADAAQCLAGDADAVPGPAEDGGWGAWHAVVLDAVAMSTPDTFARTFAALQARAFVGRRTDPAA